MDFLDMELFAAMEVIGFLDIGELPSSKNGLG